MPKDDKLIDKTPNPDLEQLQGLYDLMLEKGLDSVEIKDEDCRVRLTRRMAVPVAVAAPHHAPARSSKPDAASDSSAPAANGETIPSPLAGIFYRASSPSSASFVKEGDAVEAGQTLCIVEAMKVMNEIKAEKSCRILKILVENGRPVTAAQPLFQAESA